MNRLYLTLERPHVGEAGLPVDAFIHTLTGMQDAMRLMVEHSGGRQPGPGQPSRWVRDQSSLQLTAVRPGSLVAELTLAPPDRQLPFEDYAEQALTAICNWDGSQDSTLPTAVTDRLCDIPSARPMDVRLWLGSAETPRRIEITRPCPAARSWGEPFDMDEFLNDPNPKIFDPDNLVTASEPFDVDEFVGIIHAGRDEGRKD